MFRSLEKTHGKGMVSKKIKKYLSFFVGGKGEEDLAKGGRKGYCRAEHVQFRDYRSG